MSNSIEKFLLNFQYETPNFCYERSKGIIIDYSKAEESLVTNQFEEANLLNGDKKILTEHDTLFIYTMAYILYYEIGYALYDENMQNLSQIEKECKADEFVFDAMKSICRGNKDVDNFRLLSIIIGIVQILLKEKNDKNYSYSKERLYRLLNYWAV